MLLSILIANPIAKTLVGDVNDKQEAFEDIDEEDTEEIESINDFLCFFNLESSTIIPFEFKKTDSKIVFFSSKHIPNIYLEILSPPPKSNLLA